LLLYWYSLCWAKKSEEAAPAAEAPAAEEVAPADAAPAAEAPAAEEAAPADAAPAAEAAPATEEAK